MEGSMSSMTIIKKVKNTFAASADRHCMRCDIIWIFIFFSIFLWITNSQLSRSPEICPGPGCDRARPGFGRAGPGFSQAGPAWASGGPGDAQAGRVRPSGGPLGCALGWALGWAFGEGSRRAGEEMC